MLGSLEVIPLALIFWLLGVWVFYMVIKAAVRNGILEAEARRATIQARYDGSAPRDAG